MWRNRRGQTLLFEDVFLKVVENLLEKRYNLSNERTVVGAEFSAKALVEKCGNVGMTCVARGAVMPLMFRPPKGGREGLSLSTV
jgi:hypothetical protein